MAGTRHHLNQLAPCLCRPVRPSSQKGSSIALSATWQWQGWSAQNPTLVTTLSSIRFFPSSLSSSFEPNLRFTHTPPRPRRGLLPATLALPATPPRLHRQPLPRDKSAIPPQKTRLRSGSAFPSKSPSVSAEDKPALRHGLRGP